MSSITNTNTHNFSTTPSGAITTDSPEVRPEHHVHKMSEPLPGARGGAPAADYNPETMARLPSAVWTEEDGQPTREAGELNQKQTSAEERSSSVHAPPEGGVAVDGEHDDRDAPPKASAADKLIGKAQTVVGKVVHKPGMQEKGELRAAGGNAA
ncbi:hypothetical protein DFH07DRAFT_947595 [Mycena maculata]|uniref:Uncharacterized protein n=1 Tax=Mycena maculata TaxID=230809 RepID=A0AAD7HC46_9AGAR|nr:hypothetical protein DFH07DRAFT_947595 [Mycena maculata]